MTDTEPRHEAVGAPATVAAPPRPRLRGRLHLWGAVVLAASGIVLWQATTDPLLRTGTVVYVAGVTLMLGVSALYHVPRWSPATAQALRRADHSAIFLAVAGTYTPLVLATLRSRWGAALLAVVWLGAVGGIVARNRYPDARRWARTAPYIVLGWLGVLALPGLVRHSLTVTLLVLGGGVAYTLGAVVYARRRPDPWPATFGYHEVFHALTLVAIAQHWLAVHAVVAD